MKISALIAKLQKLEAIQPDAEIGIVCGDDAFEVATLKLETIVGEDDTVVSMASINVAKV